MTRAGSARILVVEDEPAVAALLTTLLRDEGYTVTLARDGATALDLLPSKPAAEAPFDVVLLDMMLPGVPGHAVLQRGLAVSVAAPIIALSADADALVQAAALGATATLGKPFDVGDLLALVERYGAPPQR